jgi:nucleoside permease NupC
MQYLGLIGLALLLELAWLFCEKRKSIKWRTVMAGFTLQVALAILLVKLPASRLRSSG